MVSLNMDASSGCFASQSKMGMPSDFSNPLFPGLEPNRAIDPNPRDIQSLARVRIVARAEPGAPVLSASPSGVKAKRCDLILGQDAEVRERPHEAVEGGCMSPGGPGKFVGDASVRSPGDQPDSVWPRRTRCETPSEPWPSGRVAREVAPFLVCRDCSQA